MCNLEEEIVRRENTLFKKKQLLRKEEREVIELKVALREQTLKQQFDKFIARQKQHTQDSVYLNNVLLHAAVKSHFYDIHRYKTFAGSEWANEYKQAAYTIKWIVKFRPIQIKETTKNVTPAVFDINLIFALLCGFSFLNRKIVDVIMQDKVRIDLQSKNASGDNIEENSFYDKLLYIMRYRAISGKQLVAIFESLELGLQ
jgi:hypothetical protein